MAIHEPVPMNKPDEEAALRQQAVRHLKKRCDFHNHLAAYVTVNAFLILIWGITGAGYFWPIFCLGFWGIGLVLNAWDVYRTPDFREEQIRHEMDRIRDHR